MSILYQLRDTVSLIPANWIRIDHERIDLSEKSAVRASFKRWDRIQHFFGYGPWGFHTLRIGIDTIINQCIGLILQPHAPDIQKVLEGKIHELPEKQTDDLIRALENVEKVVKVRNEMFQRVNAKFLKEKWTVRKCVLIAALIFKYIVQKIRKVPLLSSETVRQLQLKSGRERYAFYKKQLMQHQTPCLLWEGQDGSTVLRLFITVSIYSEQIILSRNHQRVGSIIFCKDLDEEKELYVLTLTNSKAETKEAQELLSRFLSLLGTTGKCIGEGLVCYPNTFNVTVPAMKHYQNVRVYKDPRLTSIQTIINGAQADALFSNLIPIEDIMRAVELIR